MRVKKNLFYQYYKKAGEMHRDFSAAKTRLIYSRECPTRASRFFKKVLKKKKIYIYKHNLMYVIYSENFL